MRSTSGDGRDLDDLDDSGDGRDLAGRDGAPRERSAVERVARTLSGGGESYRQIEGARSPAPIVTGGSRTRVP